MTGGNTLKISETIELLPFVPPEVHGFYEIYPRGPQFKKVALEGDVHKLLLQCRWPLFFVVFFFPKFWEPEVTKYYAPPYNFLFRPWTLAIADL